MPDPTQSPATAPPASGSPSSPLTALSQVGLLALGLVDLAFDQLRQLTDRGRQTAHHSDLPHLLTDGMRELHARGELAARRMTQDSDNYLELMARKVVAQRGAAGDG
ncbi:hypothetical protein [Streptomyces roseochromogenus]|uniref:Uncharacterized protein n=1 Tax=Streptomyces roseochromogenus subsp. oscitans DS 12.976 TaxID=1352936 RepID=V6KZ24_STRRC|nr:hypothetical protein [Streptomyces roseochromogenus]EST36686.1 hypothetical protein M878_00905 [Streptomyces roseochromogenus subsp. oscitans DS 12.976]